MFRSFGKLRVVAVATGALLCAAAIPARAQDTSLAVVATDRTLDPLADLLTVELSKQDGVTLLDRGEVNRILREQQLTAFSGSNCVTLGRLMRADGVIALRRATRQQQELLVADLVSVGLGFRVNSFADRFPADNPATWISDLASRLTPHFPKLGVQPRDAIPISLLNLRAAVMTTEAKVLERSLSFLLADRLIRQPQVFLMERQHLGALELDKDYMTGAGPPEWAGARFVIDGEILKDGPGPDKITLRLTIEPPQDQPTTAFTVSGSRLQLGQLVDGATSKILAAIGRPTQQSQWQPLEEAKRFCREGISADRVGLDEEALAASEASHALGCRSDELIGLLVRQSCRKAFSGRGGLSDGYDPFQVNEATLDIGLVQRALELANSRTNGPDLDVLLTAARVIRHYRETNGYSTHRQELETLRTTLRATVEKFTAQEKGKANLLFWGFLASYAPYLYDDPREVIERYRCVLDQRFSVGLNHAIYLTARVRHYLAEARDTPRLFGIQSQHTPWLVAWRNESPETLNRIWNAFLKELSASTNVHDRLDGLLLRLYNVEGDPARVAVEGQIRDALWNSRQSIATNTVTYAIAMQLLYAMNQNDEEFMFKLLDYFLKEADFYDWQIFERSANWFNGVGFGFQNPRYQSTLLKSMDEYGERAVRHGDFQPAEFAGYRRRLLPMAAGQSSHAPTRILQMNKSWQPTFSGRTNHGSRQFAIRKVIYRDSRIWVLGRGQTWLAGTNTVWLKVFQVDPLTLTETVLDVPWTAAIAQTSSVDMDYDFDVSSRHVVVATHGLLMRYDRAQRAWTSTEVPPSDFPAVTILGDDLYYAFPGHMGIWGKAQVASGIIRINPQTLEQQVLASNRRKQSPTVLDDVPAYRIPSLFPGPTGDLHAIVSFDPGRGGENVNVFRYDETAKDWTRVLANEFKGIRARFGLLAFADAGGTWFQRLEVSSKGAPFSAARLNKNGQLEPLIGSASHAGAQRAPWLAPEAPWDYSNPPSTPLIATRDGKDCWVLLKHLTASSDALALYHYTPGREKPTVILLGLANSQTVGAGPFPCLFATSAGLLVGNAGGAAFWIIPWPELDEFLMAGKETNAPTFR